MPKFEVLDARIASALNKIIHNSHFKRRVSLEEHKAQKELIKLRTRESEKQSQIEDNGKKKYRARFTKHEFLGPETEIMKETQW